MPVVFLGLGSNLGDRRKNILDAALRLKDKGVDPVKLSSMIETAPVGGPPQGLFINAVLKARTCLTPPELLRVVLAVEAGLGRVRTVRNGPRQIDIDILLYDDRKINSPTLVIPHPRMHERDFVMRPFREVKNA
jgi:2-amino-4-hydroxy-6-hydroxymethyldihydropteridine diphosphokinase